MLLLQATPKGELSIVGGVRDAQRGDLYRDKCHTSNPKSKIQNLKCGAACVRETQAANFTEGLTVGYAEMIGKRQFVLVGDCAG